MKKYLLVLLCFCSLSGLCSCNSNSNKESSIAETSRVNSDESTSTTENKTEQATTSENDATLATSEQPTSENIVHINAKDVYDYLCKNTENIGTFIEFDEKTDENELLGRPNQYTSKVDFAITTLEQKDETDLKGGSIEVFENNEDAVARATYIENIGKEYPFLVEYDYVNDYILLRIDKSITPSEAERYNKALQEIFNK